MKVWEVVHRDYKGESGKLVFWVAGERKDVKKAITKKNRARMYSQLEARKEDVDFFLPKDFQALKEALA